MARQADQTYRAARGRRGEAGSVLLEAALAVAIFSLTAGMLAPRFGEQYELRRLERTAAEVRAIQDAGKSYFATTGHWPCAEASCGDALAELQATGYLPPAAAWAGKNPWGFPYQAQATASRTFAVSCVMPAQYEGALKTQLPLVSVDPVLHRVTATAVNVFSDLPLDAYLPRDGSRAMAGDLQITAPQAGVTLTDTPGSLLAATVRSIAGILSFQDTASQTRLTLSPGELATSGALTALGALNIGAGSPPVTMSQEPDGSLRVNTSLVAPAVYTPHLLGGPAAASSIVIDGSEVGAGTVRIQPLGGRFASGPGVQALGANSIAIGSNVRTDFGGGLVLGVGASAAAPLVNSSTNSLLAGFGGEALRVYGGPAFGSLGRVAVGGGAGVTQQLGVAGDMEIAADGSVAPLLVVPNVFGGSAARDGLTLRGTSAGAAGAVSVGIDGGQVLIGRGTTVLNAPVAGEHYSIGNNTPIAAPGQPWSTTTGVNSTMLFVGDEHEGTVGGAEATTVGMGRKNNFAGTYKTEWQKANSDHQAYGTENYIGGDWSGLNRAYAVGNRNRVQAAGTSVRLGNDNGPGDYTQPGNYTIGSGNANGSRYAIVIGRGNYLNYGFWPTDDGIAIGSGNGAGYYRPLLIGRYLGVSGTTRGAMLMGSGASAAAPMQNSAIMSDFWGHPTGIGFGFGGTLPAAGVVANSAPHSGMFVVGTVTNPLVQQSNLLVGGDLYATAGLTARVAGVARQVYGGKQAGASLAIESTKGADKGTVGIAPLGGGVAVGLGATAPHGIALGTYTKGSAAGAIVIGQGASAAAPLENQAGNSLLVGFGAEALRVSGSAAAPLVNVAQPDRTAERLNVGGSGVVRDHVVVPSVFGSYSSGGALLVNSMPSASNGLVRFNYTALARYIRADQSHGAIFGGENGGQARWRFNGGSLALIAYTPSTPAGAHPATDEYRPNALLWDARDGAFATVGWYTNQPTRWGEGTFVTGYAQTPLAADHAVGLQGNVYAEKAVAIGGYRNHAEAPRSVAIGSYLKNSAADAFMLGTGNSGNSAFSKNLEPRRFVISPYRNTAWDTTTQPVVIENQTAVVLGDGTVRTGQLNLGVNSSPLLIGDPARAMYGRLVSKGSVVIGDPSAVPAGGLAVAGGLFVNNPDMAYADANVAGSLWAQGQVEGGYLWVLGALQGGALTATGDLQLNQGALGSLRAASGRVGDPLPPAGAALAVSGRVDIGAPGSPTGLLNVGADVHAEGYAMYAAAFVNPSDARYKRNVQPLLAALDTLGQLKGVSYDWRRDQFPDRNFARGRQLGFIAQELAPVLPELVTTGADGYQSVNYSGAIPLLVEAVKELDRQLTAIGRAYTVARHTGADGVERLTLGDPASLKGLVSISRTRAADPAASGYLAARDLYLAEAKRWAAGEGEPHFLEPQTLASGTLPGDWQPLAPGLPAEARLALITVSGPGQVTVRSQSGATESAVARGQSLVELGPTRGFELAGAGGEVLVQLVGWY